MEYKPLPSNAELSHKYTPGDISISESETIKIPSGIPLNIHLSDEEIKSLKALADDDGYIRIGG